MENQCICGSKKIERTNNVGWDVTENEAEDQHEDKCLDCGATRIVFDYKEYKVQGEKVEYKTILHLGNWMKSFL